MVLENLEGASGRSQRRTRRRDQKFVFGEGGECCEEAGRRRRVSSSVAESLGQDRDLPLHLICGLAHCCRRTQRERERRRIGGTISASCFVRNCVRGQCLRSRAYVYNP